MGVSITLQGFNTANGTVANLITDLTGALNDTIVTNASATSASASFQVGANNQQTVTIAIDSAMSNATNAGVGPTTASSTTPMPPNGRLST